jgi:hypothetical protein
LLELATFCILTYAVSSAKVSRRGRVIFTWAALSSLSAAVEEKLGEMSDSRGGLRNRRVSQLCSPPPPSVSLASMFVFICQVAGLIVVTL